MGRRHRLLLAVLFLGLPSTEWVFSAQTGPQVEISVDAARIVQRGILLKEIPIRRSNRGTDPVRSSRVSKLDPPRPVEEIRASQGRPAPLISRRGVDAMPGTYAVELENGSVLFVAPPDLVGLTWQKRSTRRLRLILAQFQSLVREVSVLQLEMEEPAARRLYWVLREGTEVFY